MPNYAGSEWAGRAMRRKGVRDDARARFEALAGMQPVRQQDDNAHAPQEQLLKVVRLLQVTRDAGVTGDQKAALVDMARALAATGLGKGPMGAVAQHVTSVHSQMGEALMAFFPSDYVQRRW